MIEPCPILVAIREDLARLEAAAAGVQSLDEAQLAELSRWSGCRLAGGYANLQH